MNAIPLVSIIVPVYNVESYLRLAIDSILAQTFTDFELILINDGSTDRSGEIIDSYKARDSRIVAVHKENEGVARTLNRGLAMARGKYIRRFDSDDTCQPTALEHQVVYMEKHPDVAMVSTQQAYQTQRGRIARHHRMPPNDYFIGEPLRRVQPVDFYTYCPIVHGTVLIRKNMLDEIGTYRTEFKTSEDNDLWLRVCEKFPVVVLNECSYFLRLHGSSATARYASTNKFYRELALKFHEERIAAGSDPLQRGEPMPQPPATVQSNAPEAKPDGHTYRGDLDFMYRLMVDARDWPEVKNLARKILTSGWRLSSTYKLLLFPLLGDTLVRKGVRFKRAINLAGQ